MFTLRSERAAGSGAAAGEGIALPLDLPGAGAGFAEQFAGLRAEVERFISEGGADPPMPLTPEAGRLRLQLRAGTDASAAGADGQAFLVEMLPHAQQAAAKLGVAPDILLAQAALESGWGRKPLAKSDGGNSHNLFGIKAGAGWRGEVATALTSEFEHGRKVARVESFRAYPDYQAAFEDYARLLASQPRYRAALGVGNDEQAFAEALARGGYASDPAYADKLGGLVRRLRENRGGG